MHARFPCAGGALALILFCDAIVADAQVQWTDVSAKRGILPYAPQPGQGAGVAAADYDDDGLIDLFVPTAAGAPDRLYRNTGGAFIEVGAAAGVASTVQHREALWFDYDADGDLDLLVAGDCHDANAGFNVPCDGPHPPILYRQYAPGLFEDVTAAAGLTASWATMKVHHLGGLAAGDINGDGYLDFFASLWRGPARLFLNNRNGAFTDISSAVGGGVNLGHWQPVLFDFDGDGWQDIFVAIDFGPNLLWINQRDGAFVNGAAAAGINSAWNEMGVALGDIDNDGDLDVYITNIFQNGRHNVLFRNDATPQKLHFVEIAQAAGVAEGWWGWGTTFLDFDNDGRVDLAATNGFAYAQWLDDPSRLFRNTGTDPVTFADVSKGTNFEDTYWGSALLALDYDRDGDLDLVQSCMNGPLRLLENRPITRGVGNWLLVRPRMLGPNHHAIGAVVRVTADGRDMMRVITAGISFLGQEPAEAHFGLGAAEAADAVRVEWPDGTSTLLASVPANSVVPVVHGGPGDLNADGRVDAADRALFLACYTGTGDGAVIYAFGCRAADFLGDGDVDCDDWQIFRAAHTASSGFEPLAVVTDFVNTLLGLDTSPVLLCIADMNHDGRNDSSDIAPYLAAVLDGPEAGAPLHARR